MYSGSCKGESIKPTPSVDLEICRSPDTCLDPEALSLLTAQHVMLERPSSPELALATAVLGMLEVTLLGGRNLEAHLENSAAHMFVKLSLGQLIYQSANVPKGANPAWSEQRFCFPVTDPSQQLRLHLWNDSFSTDPDDHSSVAIPFAHFYQCPGTPGWYRLQDLRDDQGVASPPSSSRSISLKLIGRPFRDPLPLGDLSVRLRFFDYTPLLAQLTAPPLPLLHAAAASGGIPSDQTSSSLVYVLRATRQLDRFLRLVTASEVAATSNPNTLFRTTSVTTKLSTMFALLVGREYLCSTFGTLLSEYCDPSLEIEVDPAMLSGDDIPARIQAATFKLLEFASRFLMKIVSSAPRAPLAFRSYCAFLAHTVGERFGHDSAYPDVAISSFTILRFFNPAIIEPVKYGLLDGHSSADDSSKRRLILLSKVLQNIANNGLPLKSAEMQRLNEFIRLSAPKLREYFELLRFDVDMACNDEPPFEDLSEVDLIFHLDSLFDWIRAKSSSIVLLTTSTISTISTTSTTSIVDVECSSIGCSLSDESFSGTKPLLADPAELLAKIQSCPLRTQEFQCSVAVMQTARREGADVTLYLITVTKESQRSEAVHRFSDFLVLQRALVEASATRSSAYLFPSLPPKGIFAHSHDSPSRLEKRRAVLQIFLQYVLTAPAFSRHSAVLAFVGWPPGTVGRPAIRPSVSSPEIRAKAVKD